MTETGTVLLNAAEHYASRPDDIPAAINDPNWDDAGKCHDWRNHVPGEIRKVWANLPDEARLSIFIMAANLAANEEWE